MTLCRAPSPPLLVGDFAFQGGRCRASRGHWGPHRNRDGTEWHLASDERADKHGRISTL